ncbi:MAG: hypothetical protein WKF91_15525 [Segetibacter sp.]
MTLYNIEKAIRPQFSWVDNPCKKLQTKDNRERHMGLGLIVFIGIASSYSIPKIDTLDYLCIESKEYESKLKIFSDQWSVIMERKENKTLYSFKDDTDRLYLKTKLTLNALNSQFLGQTLHCALII